MNASKKKDREFIASQFIAIAEQHGAKVERRDRPQYPGLRGQSIGLSFRLNGVGAMLSISDLHGGGGAIISWHNDFTERTATRYFSGDFNAAVGEFHYRSGQHHKATSGGTWSGLQMMLQGGLAHAKQGTAFVETPDPHKQMVADFCAFVRETGK